MKTIGFFILLFTITAHVCHSQRSNDNAEILKGEWEGAGIMKSHANFGKETLFNSRLVIDSANNEYITGTVANVVQEFDYASCMYRFKARKSGDGYTAKTTDFRAAIDTATGTPHINCYERNELESAQTMNITLTSNGLLVTFTGKYASSKEYYFKSKPGIIAIQQDKKINELYESWKSLKPGEKEKQRAERIEKWYNQRELYSLTTRTKDLDKTGFSYKYFPADSLLVVKMDNVVPIPFKMTPEDYKSLDYSYIDALKIGNAFFQTMDIDSDYGLKGIWAITGCFENLVPGKKIYYPSREIFDQLMNITQTKFSEKIGSTLITLPKVPDEKIFANIAWKTETNTPVNAVTRTTVPDATVQQDLSALANCRKLVQTGKSQEEKQELQKNYQALLGVVEQLGRYRAAFLAEGKLINLFPTAYYHTTVSEMKRIIAATEFTYPIEKMKQMLAFYDAYKFSRESWDNKNLEVVEKHWLEHFRYAEDASTCFYSGFVLSTGIAAHVKLDLLRALHYAYENRFNKALERKDIGLKGDFYKTNTLFADTRLKTTEDIKQALSCNIMSEWLVEDFSVWKEGLGVDIYNKAYQSFTAFFDLVEFNEAFTDKSVIKLREDAWSKFQQKVAVRPFNGNTLMSQPVVDHTSLMNAGEKLCPSEKQPGRRTFVINPKDVTLPTDKEFKWYNWEDAPEDLRIAAEYIHTYKDRITKKDETLVEEIERNQKGNCKIKIAAIDLNNDGICGLAVVSEGFTCCGTLGCMYDIFDNGGLLTCGAVNAHGGSPAKNGMMGDNQSFLFQLVANSGITVDKNEIVKLFTYDKTKTSQSVNVPVPANLAGGANPEELGKQMLKALQTNNKTLWAACVHPTYRREDPTHRQQVIDEFDKIRNEFESQGVSDWTKTSFSRVTFERCDQCAPPGEKWVRHLVVEFWYKGKEFLCAVAFTPVITYKGKYFVGSNYFHDVKRNINK